jgi:hypothetical protein
VLAIVMEWFKGLEILSCSNNGNSEEFRLESYWRLSGVYLL